MSSKPWKIYGLFDPRDSASEVRYVGITTCGLNVRLTGHMNYSKKLRTHRDFWIQSLVKAGVKPSLFCMEEGEGKEAGIQAEQKWIQFYTSERLTNTTLGGEGLVGYKHSEATKEKLRLANTTPEALERNRKLHKGKKVSPEAIEKTRQANLGLKRSAATRKLISEIHSTPEAKAAARLKNLGKVMSDESREKMRQSHLGKKQSPEAIEKVRAARLGSTMPEGALAKAWETRRRNKLLKTTLEGIENGN